MLEKTGGSWFLPDPPPVRRIFFASCRGSKNEEISFLISVIAKANNIFGTTTLRRSLKTTLSVYLSLWCEGVMGARWARVQHFHRAQRNRNPFEIQTKYAGALRPIQIASSKSRGVPGIMLEKTGCRFFAPDPHRLGILSLDKIPIQI